MKRFILPFLFVCIFLLTGCDKDKAGIVFSKVPFTNEKSFTEAKQFEKGERIYYAVYNPHGFKTRLLKLQVFKKENEKSEFWGYEYLYNKTLELKDKRGYQDYVVINNKGFYIFQIFDFTNFSKPVALGIVKVE